MPTYNVKAQVVELVEADSPEQAITFFHLRLHEAGFEVFEPEGSDAFVSESEG